MKFVNYKKYQNISENDFVVIMNTGAYGSSLSSNYNTKPLIAELLVNKNKYKVIKKKQNLLKLIKINAISEIFNFQHISLFWNNFILF